MKLPTSNRVSSLLPAGFLCLWLLLSTTPAAAQASQFEEIVVTFEVQRLIKTDMFVRYDGQYIYLPILETFGHLDINVQADLPNDLVYGYFAREKDRYELDLRRYTARTHLGEFELPAGDFYKGDHEIYLSVERFVDLFGLDLQFDFSLLRVYMKLDKALPAYQALQRRLAREKLQQEETALRDVRRMPLARDYFNGGVLDWTISANPLGRDQYFDLTGGAQLLGGDLTVNAAGNTIQGFDRDQFYYRWHYYIQDNPWISQVDLGEMYTPGPLARSLEGGMVSNRPQVQRQYFQTINLEGAPGPGWEVELYVDNKLTDFMYTDQSGAYRFNLDIVYGSSLITIKMYGPNGEIRTEEQYVRIPYNLIPKNAFEYSLAAGRSTSTREDGSFGQATLAYGLLSNLTVGAAADVPFVPDDTTLPLFAGDITFQPLGNLAVNGSYAPNYQAMFSLNYSKPSMLSVSASATKHFENAVRNPFNRDYSVSLAASAPFRIRGRYFGLRYNVLYEVQPSVKITNMTYGMTASVWRLYLNYIGQYKISEYPARRTDRIESQMIASIRAFRWIQPQIRVDYNHSENTLSRYGLFLSKRFWRSGQATLSLERNELSQSNQITLAVNFFTDFIDLTGRVTQSRNETNWSQTLRGSVRYDQPTNDVQFKRRSGVGFGAAVVRPFHDANYNGRHDPDEEYLPDLRAKLRGAGGHRAHHNRAFYYDNLRAYDDYIVQIDEYSLDNPLLKPTHEHFQVTVPPNTVTEIKVPIVTAGEISGSVRRETELGPAGVGGIRIILLNTSKEAVTEITTFNDGEFYYLGLLPGDYQAYVDPAQLKRYNYTAEPALREFTLKPVEGGAVLEGLDFVLTRVEVPAPTN